MDILFHQAHIRHDLTQVHIQLCQTIYADHTDFINAQPSPLRYPLRCCYLCAILWFVACAPLCTKRCQAQGMMQCVTVYIISIDSLESSNLKIDAWCPSQQLFEKLLFQYFNDMTLPCIWPTVQQSYKLCRFSFSSIPFVIPISNDLLQN